MAGQWQRALDLFSSMQNFKVRADRILFSAVICACDSGGQWQVALQLFTDMGASKLPIDTTSCNATISACGKNEQWQPALALFSSMRLLKVAPDLVGFNAAISSCEKAGQWQLGLGLLYEMPRSQVAPDVISYTASIGACEKAAKWQLAASLFEELHARHLQPTVISYSAMISACQKAGQWQLALHFFSEMPRAEVSPNFISYNATITASERGGQWQLALFLFNSMPKARISPSITSFNATLAACGKGEEWPLALHLFSTMAAARASPNIMSYNAMLDSLGDHPIGRRVFQEAMDTGVYGRLCEESPLILDLHQLSYGPALHAVSWWLSEELMHRLSSTERTTCIIITGWGKTRPSWSSSNLQNFVLALLKQWGLAAAVQRHNQGRLEVVLGRDELMRFAGFLSVYNQPVDCYAAWEALELPEFDILVTNPPYSGDHVMGPVKVENDSFAEFTRDVLGRCWGTGDFTVVVEEPAGDQTEGTESPNEMGICRREFVVLSAVLGTASPVFENMVKQDNFVEGAKSQVTITDFSSAAVEAFLRFLHFGTVEGSLATVLELGVLADKYAVSKLHRLCTGTVQDELVPTTACAIFELADRFHNMDLRRCSLDMILTEPAMTMKKRPGLSPQLVEEIVGSEALCISSEDLQDLICNWDEASSEEEREVQRLLQAYAEGPATTHRRVASGDALFELKESYWGHGRQIALLLGPPETDWSDAVAEPGFLEALAHNDNFHTYSIAIQDGWIVWMMPFVSLYLTSFSFNARVLTEEVHFKVFCSEDGIDWKLCLDSKEHGNIEEDEDVCCEHRHVKWLKLLVVDGRFSTDFCVSGILLQPMARLQV
ncbi:unnamed protein product [Symbiodinium microadriaticum]|nr:unnamed protein product [Symbiodinium microadriaticum]